MSELMVPLRELYALSESGQALYMRNNWDALLARAEKAERERDALRGALLGLHRAVASQRAAGYPVSPRVVAADLEARPFLEPSDES